jgi:IS1 family transposase
LGYLDGATQCRRKLPVRAAWKYAKVPDNLKIGRRFAQIEHHERVENIKGVHVGDIQIDEQWQFILCKKATAKAKKYVGGCGDSYTYTAIERDTKLIVAWHFGKRDEKHTTAFIAKLAKATVGRFHLTSDGWSCYPMAVWKHLEGRVDYGMLVKIYGEGSAEDQRRYRRRGSVVHGLNRIAKEQPSILADTYTCVHMYLWPLGRLVYLLNVDRWPQRSTERQILGAVWC